MSFLTLFITDLQQERDAVALALFMNHKTKEKTNMTLDFRRTDLRLLKVQWRKFGPQRIFSTKLRFQIRLDDFR